LLEEEEGDLSSAQRDQTLAALMPLSKKFLRKKYNQPEPEDEEDATAPPAVPGASDPEGGSGDEPQGGDGPVASALARIAGIKDDALFAKSLRDLARTEVLTRRHKVTKEKENIP
jgi:hypothetical protein